LPPNLRLRPAANPDSSLVGHHVGDEMGGHAAVTEGFAIGFGWVMLFVLLGVLAYFLLRKPR
jgi:hypothetical protein